MSRTSDPYLVVAERRDLSALEGLPVLTPDEYLEGKTEEALSDRLTVINLCRSYEYLSKGYYVSLLADARHQRAFPTVGMIEEVASPFTYFHALREAGAETIDFRVLRDGRVLPRLILPKQEKEAPEGRKPLVAREGKGAAVRYEPTPGEYQEITSVFGRTLDARFRRHCSEVFRVYPFPLLRVRVYREEERWKLGQILPLPLDRIGEAERALLVETIAERRFRSVDLPAERTAPNRIAVLMEEGDAYAPSDEGTFERLRRVGEGKGVQIERIGRADLDILAEYDALFIRTVTGIDHFSFVFAQRARSLGIPVIDDPRVTVRCSNKVFLHELFRKNGLPIPRTLTVSRKAGLSEAEGLGYPLILKLPDGTFSAAVKKVADRDELERVAAEMFRRSPLLILQEYRPTEFDWRVGVLDGRLLYVCRYHMVRGHWQIIGVLRSGRARYGVVEAVAGANVPEPVRRLALEAAGLIGDGLYGVDIKETEAGPLVIEINDNPDLWVGEEDAVEGDRLYEALVDAFDRRIREGLSAPVTGT